MPIFNRLYPSNLHCVRRDMVCRYTLHSAEFDNSNVLPSSGNRFIDGYVIIELFDGTILTPLLTSIKRHKDHFVSWNCRPSLIRYKDIKSIDGDDICDQCRLEYPSFPVE
ncbi:MAG: hypothetical protein GY804_08745 [Alphaproteobacteria bacterium]|nr:hypothetical protein [Alphaproteobacteria bacterium]